MRTILIAATLATVPLAAPGFAAPRGAVVSPAHRVDDDAASMRRTLASVLVLQKLQLSPAQKHDLSGVIADMKQLRDERQTDKSFQAIQDERKALLQKAIDEARAKGEVSPETKDAMLALRDKTREAMKPYAGRGKDVMKRLKGILTTDQIESLKDLRGEVGAFGGAGREGRGVEGVNPGFGGNPDEAARSGAGVEGRREHRGRGMLLKLLLSDEFQAELAK